VLSVSATATSSASQMLAPEDMHLKVLFEDEHLIAVLKPAGVIVQPMASAPKGTLLHGIMVSNLNMLQLHTTICMCVCVSSVTAVYVRACLLLSDTTLLYYYHCHTCHIEM
jgi:hypothetical protein